MIFIGHYSVGFSQDMARDTMHIVEVNIVRSRIKYLTDVDKTRIIDSAILYRYSSQDLATLLQKTSLIRISSNGGSGTLSTASIRGASSTNTVVNWNGLPINSLTTGSADLSLISVGGFNNISIVYGASGAIYGSGTLGGVINLSNEPEWNNNFSVGLSTEIGGFSGYSDKFYSKGDKLLDDISSVKSQLYVKASNDKISYSGQLIYQSSKNNFKYTDTHDFGSPEEQLNNNENKVIGTVQDVHVKLKKQYFDGGIWYQVKEKNIPGLMGIGDPISFQEQKDSLLRTYIRWKTILGCFRLEMKGAYLYDFLRYTDKESNESIYYKTYSEIYSKRWLSNVNARYYINNKISADVDFKYNQLYGVTNNYNTKEKDYRLSVASMYKAHHISLITTLGKEWNNINNFPIVASLNLLANLNNWSARLKAGTHYRRPTFNERYWEPGGNKDLNAEEGKSFELGFTFADKSSELKNIGGDITFYFSDNKESISWQPTEVGYWQPLNTGKMISEGMEFEFWQAFHLGKNKLQNKISYGLNHTFNNNVSDENYKETIAYHPKHTLKTSIDFLSATWSSSVIYSFQSESKTYEDNIMDAFVLMDYHFGYLFNIRKIKLNTSLRIENVLNKSYEVVYAYPMPGRAFYFTVNINY